MSEFSSLWPEIILSVAGALIMLASPILGRRKSSVYALLACSGLLAAMLATLLTWNERAEVFFGMVLVDPFSQLARLILFVVLFCIAATSLQYLNREGINFGEFYALLLFVTVGASLMVISADLILTFLAVEIMSIGTYVLAGFRRDNSGSTEASIKYFLLGSFSTAFLLYGIALLYGRTGSTRYIELASRLHSAPDALTLAGLAFILVGFGFKVATAPFHVWTPDVYQGAPLPITTFMSIGVKAAGFLAFIRVFYIALAGLNREWSDILWIVAVLTMFLGNVTALVQTNIKRLLAYSSIAHAGYILLGFVSRSRWGIEAILYYILAYALMNLGAFTVVQMVSRREESGTRLDDYAGLGRRHRWLASALSLFLFSLAGIPATAGFMGKLFLFSAAVHSGLYWLVLLAVINSAIAAYYYVRIVVLMFMREPDPGQEPAPISAPSALVIAFAASGTLLLGIFPGRLMHIVETAAAAVMR